MKNNESVGLAAVQQHGYLLEYASEEMKNNEIVVLAALQHDKYALAFASEEMKSTIETFASACSIGIQECARGMLNPMVLQVCVSAEHGTPDLDLNCHSMNGDV